MKNENKNGLKMESWETPDKAKELLKESVQNLPLSYDNQQRIDEGKPYDRNLSAAKESVWTSFYHSDDKVSKPKEITDS